MSEEIQTAVASAQTDENQLVTFFLGEEEFGFDIMSVQEIIRQPQLSRIPMAPAYVEGIANLRGMILPIIDTRTRFGMKREEDTDGTRVLVVDVDGNKTGLRVDRVRQVTRIQQSDMEPVPPVVRAGMSAEYLKGVVKLDGGKRIIMSLSPKAICQIKLDGVAETQTQASREVAVAENGQVIKDAGGDQSIAQLVTFKLGMEEFAFHMERVREILRVERPNEVPNTPKYVLGVLTVRGVILPVVDLRVLLGLPNMESEVVGDATKIREEFTQWLNGFRLATTSATAQSASGPESLRKWIMEFNTSSQALMEILGQMRVGNDKLLRTVAHCRTLDQGDASAAKALFESEIEPEAQGIIKLITDFEGHVKENIREDQRLVVVQSNGSLLALLVDKVREVLNMVKSQIDAPPQLSDSENVNLSGIAKLDGGKRLIMLLEPDDLIKDSEMKKLGGSTAKEKETGMMQQHNAGAQEQALGEQLFVTFLLGDGEYGISIAQIQEIDRSSKMTRVPLTAEYVDGITNLRGEIVPVINARKRFNLEHKDADERTRVIIMDINGAKTGLLVDSVREVRSMATKDIAPPPSTLTTSIDRQYISGIGKVDDGKRMIILLAVEKILQKETPAAKQIASS